ncbi:MAG TPA: ATPase [Eubacterium sp.]|nr:ATPase [Eubacterium sp.]
MVGREQEIRDLNRLYDRNKAELVAVYGRRRVGKTFLIDEVFADRITFRHAGLAPGDDEPVGILRAQLDHFYNSLIIYGMEECKKPDNWLDAFLLLEKYLQKIDDGSRQLIFIDELPWLDTPRSGFLRAFEGFWNNWGCHRKNLMVIVCGSANSWILDNLINNHGGLYNRVTYQIKLSPFSLKECEEFYNENHISLSRYDIVQSYMILGGIPYYMGYFDLGLSLAQNIDKLFFERDAMLKNEYDRLFESIFVNPEAMKKILEVLSTRNSGYTRKEISVKTGFSDGGGLSRYLNALVASDFVVKYVPFGFGKREEHYKLTDPFCLFYLHFYDAINSGDDEYWQHNLSSQSVVVWRGYSFENVCFNHIPQIKKALGISGVITSASAWSKREDDEEGAQIDLLLSRNDNVLNMCEIKFYGDDFAVNGDYYRKLLRRQEMLMKDVNKKTVVRSTLITTFGLKRNEYSGIFTNIITLEDLFVLL